MMTDDIIKMKAIVWEEKQVNKLTEKKAVKERRGVVYNIRQHSYTYALIAPAVLFVLIFQYFPLTGIIMAFKDFNVMDGIWGSPWVGLENFKTIFTYPDMLHAIKNTFVYGAVILFGGFPFPIILALMFNELRGMRFKKVVQTITYMPYFLSWISVIGLFYAFLSTEGTLNQLMVKLVGDGYEAKNILMDSKYFLPIIFVSHLWKNVGWSSVVFLAAIAGIDPSLYEACTIDGGNKWHQIIHITLPGIKSTIIIVLIMSLGTLVNTNFEQVYGFQNVYTQEATEVITTLIYRQGIQNGEYSLATAFGLSQGVITIFLMLTSNAIAKKLSGTSIW